MSEKAWAPPAAGFAWPSACCSFVCAAILAHIPADQVFADHVFAQQVFAQQVFAHRVLADLAPPPAPFVSLCTAAVLIRHDAALDVSDRAHIPLPNPGAVPGRVDLQVVAHGAQGPGAPGSSPVLPVTLLPSLP